MGPLVANSVVVTLNIPQYKCHLGGRVCLFLSAEGIFREISFCLSV